MVSRAASVSRPMAMARPCLSPSEAQLLPRAVKELGVKGSKSVRGAAVATEVARIAVLDVMASEDDLGARMEIGAVRLDRPSVARLALDPEIDTASIVSREAVRQFEAGGCQRLPPSQWAAADTQLREAVQKRLAGRYRKALK